MWIKMGKVKMDNNNESSSSSINERVSLITGDPKKAIRTLSLPMILSMLLMMVYNLADSIWVAGLGPNSLAALGFVTPLFMMVIGLGNGLGAGANSLISRCIGAKNKKGSDNAAIHSIILTLLVSVILTVFILVFLKDLLTLMGAGESLSLAIQYGQIVFGGLIFLIFTSVASGILRAEGDVKRPMYVMLATAILNIILDPVFIYYFGLGVSGAAIATLISASISSALILYWLMLKRDTYVSLSRKDFNPSWAVIKDILLVGLPASAEFFVMSILGILLNIMLVITGGTDAVAVYTAGWRVVMIAMIPAIGIGTAAITVAGAAYGAKRYNNIMIALNYSVKLALGVASITGLIIYVFASNIASIFAYSAQSSFMAPSIAAFLQVMCLFLIIVPFGIVASSVFQGMGRGVTSLILTVIREVLFISLFAYFLSFVLGIGEHGIWWGIVIGGAFGCAIAFVWATRFIKALKKSYYKEDKIRNTFAPGK
jgi:putative MATE family efflux protein